ncbi:MAG: pseudouridine-5'-phosphate glycosidase [Paracoccaceae bacterium]
MIEIDVSPEVQDALDNSQPVVALESTIITHGMPWPENKQVALRVEKSVRDNGAVPATIAVLNGVLKVGLSHQEISELAASQSPRKLSRADLAICLAQKATGATTVAATMIAAAKAGISVFATGGIGGVHRGAELSFDISADLQELAQTPVTVVSSGCKAILDIPKTLEVLETLGVPVIAYKQDEFPAFWSAKSEYAAPVRMDDVKEIAEAHQMRAELGISGGQLIANPIPAENEIPLCDIQPIIDEAIEASFEKKIIAKEVTPFLLSRIFELTEGKSLTANITLVLNNARLAAKIAKNFIN